MREARERECNTMVKAVGWIRKDITDLGKDLERYHGEAGIYGDAFASTQAKLCRHNSDIDRVMEQSKGDNSD